MRKINSIAVILFAMMFLVAACSGTSPTIEVTQSSTVSAGDTSMDSEKDSEMMEESSDEIGMEEPHMDDEGMEEPHTDDDSEEMGESHSESDSEEIMEEDSPSDIEDSNYASDSGDAMMVETPAYFKVVLTDPSSGQNFSIQEDLKDKVVLVETMAIWCSNCFKQQNEVKRLHGLIGEREDFASLGVDVDPNETLEDLNSYVETNGFDWTYAVAPVEVAREIDQLYGSQFLNPSSTPMLIIDKSGNVHPLPFGIKSAEELQAALTPFLN